jgi:hypothetical protein
LFVSIYSGGFAASLLRNCCLEIRAVSGGDDAGRHAREIRRACLGVAAHRARALSRDVAECPAESAEAAPTRVERDLADRHLRVPQQRFRLLDASREQVAMRRHAEGLPELPREMRGGHVAHLRETRYGPLFVRGRVHAVSRTQQAA